MTVAVLLQVTMMMIHLLANAVIEIVRDNHGAVVVKGIQIRSKYDYFSFLRLSSKVNDNTIQNC